MSNEWAGPLKEIDEFKWEIPRTYKRGMRVPGIIYADKRLLKILTSDSTPEQVANVAHLPGIVRAALAMPDAHWGFGMPIGGVAAFRPEDGVISAGAVGYDINCGVRLVRSNLTKEEVLPVLTPLVERLFARVPCGLGSEGNIRLSSKDTDRVLVEGASWALEHGFGWPEDISLTEQSGTLDGADPSRVGSEAKDRGREQLGTLGSGNHFLEVQYVEEIYDDEAAQAFGLWRDQVTIMIHCGSRGLGHQVCDDYIRIASRTMHGYGIELPDKQLACVPISSEEGKAYLGAMAAAANFAWANRQCILHLTRQAMEEIFRRSAEDLDLRMIYDLAHNIARLEEHEVEGKKTKLWVLRKGATRAYPPGRPDIPEPYSHVGQPVLIPGDMGRCSYVLVGTEKAMKETFGSTCHGAGRLMSRTQAVKTTRGRRIREELEAKGIIVRYDGKQTLHEEVSEAYKDVNQVVDVVEGAGIAKRVAKLRPMGVIKG
ncbi:MAG: RtcB family protein [Candidatus Eisenbacteria bacterium]|nr:RtcB family protein [Candidatus Eisenbacteria bacterium]